MNKYLYKIKDLEVTPWLKYWFLKRSKINFDLSEILNGTSFDLTSTVNKKLHLINIFGNSIQETTTGKNLLNSYLSNRTTNGVTVTYDENTQEITLNGTCNTDNTVFHFTKSNSFNLQSGESLYALIKYISGSSNGYLALRGYNSNYSQGINLVTTEPLTDDIFIDKFYDKDVVFTQFSIRVSEGSTFDNLKIKLMISKVDAVYEPYTNGASPNPDYPQEVKSSGDNGYIVEKFVNKNLFSSIWEQGNIDNSTGNNISSSSSIRTKDYIRVFPNIEYYMSRTIATSYCSYKFYDKNKNFLGIQSNIDITTNIAPKNMQTDIYNQIITINDTRVAYMRINDFSNDLNAKYLLQYNSDDKTYIEHQEQNFTIPCQQPMRAIGDVKDTFVNIKGVWYERHNIGEFILNGSENWNRTETKTNGNYYFFCDNVLNNILYTNNKFAGISNIGITTSVYQEIQGVDTIYYDSKNRTRIYTETTKAMTVEEFKNWLSLNNVKLIYDLLTSTDLPCTQDQITALESLSKARTYKNITHIYSNDEVPAELQIQYYKEKGE